MIKDFAEDDLDELELRRDALASVSIDSYVRVASASILDKPYMHHGA